MLVTKIRTSNPLILHTDRLRSLVPDRFVIIKKNKLEIQQTRRQNWISVYLIIEFL